MTTTSLRLFVTSPRLAARGTMRSAVMLGLVLMVASHANAAAAPVLAAPEATAAKVSAWVPPATRASDALTPEALRITDQAIARDLATVAFWQRRLDALASAEPPVPPYFQVKAAAWLEFARQQYALGDRCGAVPASLDEGATLILRLEAGERDLPMETPLPARSSKVRSDLWDLCIELKADQGFPCVEAEVAKLEMRLVAAGHEQSHDQPCDSEEIQTEAQTIADVARAKVVECRIKPAEVLASPSLPVPAERAPFRPEQTQREIELLPKFVHFALDSASLILKTQQELDQIATVMKAYPEISVRLSGHTDKRASAAYNLRLSRRRAKAVFDYLVRAGVEESRLVMEYFGKSRPRVGGESIEDFARNRCVIFDYFTPDSLPVDVIDIEKENDLQIEDPAKRRR